MRLRTVVAVTTGAAAGAGATYLFDPDHGPQRRRLARRNALRQAQKGALRGVRRTRREVAALAAAGVAGYQRGRAAPATEIGGDGRSARPADAH